MAETLNLCVLLIPFTGKSSSLVSVSSKVVQVDQDDYQLKWMMEHFYNFFPTIFVTVLEQGEEPNKQMTSF